MKRDESYRKEAIRGVIKEIMRVRGLRSISIKNYNKWLKIDQGKIHSIKLSLEDGYLYMYGFNKDNERIGARYTNITNDMYEDVFKKVNEIIVGEKNIPSKIKRNILVKISR